MRNFIVALAGRRSNGSNGKTTRRKQIYQRFLQQKELEHLALINRGFPLFEN
jgi:hypothetical protein